MKKDLTQGKVNKTLLLFAGPMILGNLLQQCYNIADTLIVGQAIGEKALASVGSAYTLMTFLTSILIGLCMGSGAVFSLYFGKKDKEGFQRSIQVAFLFIALVTVILNIMVLLLTDSILHILQVPTDLFDMMKEYVNIIFLGIFFVFLYNYFAFLLRAVGNSVTPLIFLGVSSVMNIGLDLLFVLVFRWGIAGAARATVLSQIFSGVGIGCYSWIKEPSLRFFSMKAGHRSSLEKKEAGQSNRRALKEILRFSTTTCIQQSVMNFGILMIQGLVNSFGAQVMAAFAAAVKIDSLAYMPAQEFGNAFSIFISQNHGAGKQERVRQGTKNAIMISIGFCLVISLFVFIMAPYLMRCFVRADQYEIIKIGTGYLRVEGTFYCGIGLLFLLYGYFRGIEHPEMSIVLTVISLGTRVLLAYALSPIPSIGIWGIWTAIPIGWILADTYGFVQLRKTIPSYNNKKRN